jgi:hypothetical protein
MFTIDLRTIYRGLDSLFLLKLVPFSATESKLPCVQLQSWFNLRPDPAFHIVCSSNLSPKVPVHILHLGNIVNHVFEDLRKTKAPNMDYGQLLGQYDYAPRSCQVTTPGQCAKRSAYQDVP